MVDTEMNGQARQRELDPALVAALERQADLEGYRRRQQQIQRGKAQTLDRPGPLEFDGDGFPIAQRTPSLVTRVARLLTPS